MTEDEALDALAEAIYDYTASAYGRVTARELVKWLRDHPDVARALRIGSCVVATDGRCHILTSRPVTE